MDFFPPLPSWDSAHPAVVHFPIALLMTAPVFYVLFLLWGSRSREMLTAGLVVLALGSAAAFLATATGDAGEKWAKGVEGARKLVHQHEEAAEMARNLYTGLTAVVGVLCIILWTRAKPPALVGRLVILVVLLGLTAFPAMKLAQAGHLGGRVVHDLGVKAPLTQPGQNPE